MLDKEWLDYFRKELAKSQKELADFKEAVAKHRLRIWHRDVNGETDMTDSNLNALEETVRDYQSILAKETKAAR